METDNYTKQVLRSESTDYVSVQQRLQNPEVIRLLHAAMGLSTEAGEFVDQLKRHLFYGKPLDLVNLKEECGDVGWYLGLSIEVLQTTLNEVLTRNIEKLKVRYPEKFSDANAVERDLAAERKVLESTGSGPVCGP